ncbi:25S rRNA (cytosine-C(5))-methyltransferase rcm1 [Elsinoe australis]|uniref:25S rRNA (Cytosine-C(5))-methyltransferase rcm1 n=1 Tax=Elsinoe australis TaxID=40998 RepID=A0A2P7ZU73_9PEZI|nr:25S rRNA (cytosine-C(5))-methyltransferase rcm1 [Elsinoe australis]
MSLYFEAAKVLDEIKDKPASLKDRVYKDKTLRSSPGTVFALISEATKWSEVLSEVIDKSQVLSLERKLTPSLSLILTHDLLLSKNGLSLSKKHILYDTISKHKARLTSELTRARIRRGVASLDLLRKQINSHSSPDTSTSQASTFHPRWIRINILKSTPSSVLSGPLSHLTPVSTLSALSTTPKGIYTDPHIPNLFAIHPTHDIIKSAPYLSGALILQDKASCFPAYLLSPTPLDGRVIDGCAAPGNKTTHLAAILHGQGAAQAGQQITACERSLPRAQTLNAMVRKAGAGTMVQVKAGQDFLALKPGAEEWGDVWGILLDPSCSGSGIVGRDEVGVGRKVVLPFDPRGGDKGVMNGEGVKGRKRKRGEKERGMKGEENGKGEEAESGDEKVMEDEEVDALNTTQVEGEKLKERLRALSSFQLKLLTHAFRFTGAKRITYSTCSVHKEENEDVVVKALLSDVARERGWRIMRREEQVEGMKNWERRGNQKACEEILAAVGGDSSAPDAKVVAGACIRCAKGTDEGTMGFFVAGFVRDDEEPRSLAYPGPETNGVDSEDGSDFSEFEGFD